MYTVRATALGIIVPFWTALMARILIKCQQTNTNIERFEKAIEFQLQQYNIRLLEGLDFSFRPVFLNLCDTAAR